MDNEYDDEMVLSPCSAASSDQEESCQVPPTFDIDDEYIEEETVQFPIHLISLDPAIEESESNDEYIDSTKNFIISQFQIIQNKVNNLYSIDDMNIMQDNSIKIIFNFLNLHGSKSSTLF